MLSAPAWAPLAPHAPPIRVAAGGGAAGAFHVDTVTGPSPPPMERAAMAYDTPDALVLMFGGQEWDNQVLSTTWTFAHGTWTNQTPDLSAFPPARWGAAMAYDSADSEAILFGGCPTVSCTSALGDTWAYAQGRWTDLTPLQNSSPSARDLASMAYDAQTGTILLFGGQPSASAGTTDNDTWAFTNGQWSLVGGAGVEPTSRCDASMAYDASTDTVVLFGGVTALNGGALLGDTWGYNGGSWTQLFPAASAPSPRRGTIFTFDAQDGYGLLVGGYNRGAYYADAWTLTASGWSSIAPAGSGPGASFGGMAADDPADGYVVVFSGQAARGFLDPTWAYSHGAWSTLVSPSPSGPNPVEGLLVLQLAFVVPIVLLAIAAAAIGRYRAARRAQGFQLRPSDPVHWMPSRGVAAQSAQALIVPLVLSFFLIPFDLTYVASGLLSPLGVLLLVIAPLLAIFGAFYLALRSSVIRSIGIADAGIIVQKGGSQLRIAWDDIRLPDFPVRGRSFLIRYAAPNESMGGGFVRVSTEQARAIVTHPNAPLWPISASTARALGVPPRAAAPPSAPVGPPPARHEAPLPSTPATSPSTPAPPPPAGAWVPPAPPPPPPPPPMAFAPPVQPVVVSPPTALYQVRCPGCSQTFPMGKYAFCPSCGRRLA